MSSRSDALYLSATLDVEEFLGIPLQGDIRIPPEASPKQFAAYTLLHSLLKKWNDRSVRADQVALVKFLTANERCKNWCLDFGNLRDELLFNEVRQVLYEFFHPDGQMLFDSFEDILERAYTGPGSSIGSVGHFSYYAKMFNSNISSTSINLYMMYRSYISKRPNLLEAELKRCEDFGLCCIASGSRISFAPKTVRESRLICTEPLLNSYFQLGLGVLLTERLKSFFGIDLSSQPKVNQQLAQVGSTTGRFSTIDLSSASDCISLSLCSKLLPSWVFDTLMEIRSPSTLVGGDAVRLEMMSTMGNGFTFPLQTVIFSALIFAVYRSKGILPVRCDRPLDTNFGCFGDDLIVRDDTFHSVIGLLELLGFIPNTEKTFNDGPFRESCGADWHSGHSVRGVYIKRLDSPQDICVAINLLNDWTARTGIPLTRAVSYLMGLAPQGGFPMVPFHENNDAGVRVPSLLTPLVRRDLNHSIIYRRFQVVPIKIRVLEGSVHAPRGMKVLKYNPLGLYFAFLYGEIRGSSKGPFGFIGIRQLGTSRYKPKRACTPYWDYMPRGSRSCGSLLSWVRWETALLVNTSTP